MTDNAKLEALTEQINHLARQQDLFHQKLREIADRLAAANPDNQARKQYAQLTLQLRLDTQDTLKALIRNNQSYCNVVGINSLNSQQQNLERLEYSLSADDFNLDLLNLESLLDQLESAYLSDEHSRQAQELKRQKLRKLLENIKALNKSKDYTGIDAVIDTALDQDQRSERVKQFGHARSRVGDTITHELTTALELQSQFHQSLDQLTEAITEFGHIPKFGLIYDYLAGLKGPISRYQLAIENGLTLITDISRHLLHGHKPSLQNLQQRTLALTEKTPTITQLLAHDLSKTLQPSPTVKPAAEPQIAQAQQIKRSLNLFG